MKALWIIGVIILGIDVIFVTQFTVQDVTSAVTGYGSMVFWAIVGAALLITGVLGDVLRNR